MDEGLDLFRGEGEAVSFAADDVLRMEGRGHAGVEEVRVKAAGRSSARVLRVVVVLGPGKRKRVEGEENSARVWRHAPQGVQGAWLRLATTTARMRILGPCWATAATRAACSAQTVRR